MIGIICMVVGFMLRVQNQLRNNWKNYLKNFLLIYNFLQMNGV